MSEYVKIRSWHIVKLITRASWYKTYCGRLIKDADALIEHDLPAEKSCETCLRAFKRQEEDSN